MSSPERIFVPTEYRMDGCNDELPSVEYIRADIHEARVAELERRNEELEAAPLEKHVLNEDRVAELEKELDAWRSDAVAVVNHPKGATMFNVAQASEDAIAAKLVELGWTPPENDDE